MRELAEVGRREIWDGVTARMVEGERMTLAIIEIAAGKHVPEHVHDNEQIGFVIEGTVTFTVGDQTRVLGPGGSWRILSNVPHHAEVGPEGAVVAEAYAPGRADWANLPLLGPATPIWPHQA
ncbi:cupin domain-containing protein [Fodinicola feengrottensis]|uniref:Cupin type-2 domain-containing protein n=1 Tax=Fodinicola feengrottensis TaxID=435914 RepID=A0ABN2FXF7_9ACTN|nr:cupin domain-containing protein [Fodinicola feengrottensis]